MFFKKIDRITPPITLFFKGNRQHSTIFSGILTVIIRIILFIFTILYFLDYINKSNPSAFYFNRFIDDAGELFFNSSSLLHYIYFITKNVHSVAPFDYDIFRIIGLQQINIDTYYTSVDLTVTPHWLYGLCNNDSKEMKVVGYLIPPEEKENSACIRKYYNPNTKKYYDYTDKSNFIWPSLAHGMSNSNYTYYGIIVEKCKDDELRALSGYGKCKSNEEITNYITSNAIALEFIDHYPDVLNYKKPFTKYFYSVSNLLYQTSFTVNHINLNPAKIITHNGIFFDNVIEEYSYLFDQNEKVSFNEEIQLFDDEKGEVLLKSTGIVSSFYFWMQNRLQLYERNYKKFQDVLSNIGGFSRILFLVAKIINTLMPEYIILLDTEELLISLNKGKLGGQSLKNLSIMQNDFASPLKKKNDKRHSQQLSNSQRPSKENNTIIHKDFSGIEKRQLTLNKYANRNKHNITNNFFINNEENKNANKNNEIEVTNFFKIKKHKFRNKESDQNIFSGITSDKYAEFRKYTFLEKQNFNWFKYIWHKIYCGKKIRIISYYEKIRKKTISEEGIFRGSLDIYNILQLLKLDEIKEINNIKDNNCSLNQIFL